MKSKNDEEFHQEEKLREEAKQEEQAKRAGEAPADIDAQYVRLLQEVSASKERAENLLRNGPLGPHFEALEQLHADAERKARAPQGPLLREIEPFLQDKVEEQKRLRAQQDAPELKLAASSRQDGLQAKNI
jgi:hypothetical protein